MLWRRNTQFHDAGRRKRTFAQKFHQLDLALTGRESRRHNFRILGIDDSLFTQFLTQSLYLFLRKISLEHPQPGIFTPLKKPPRCPVKATRPTAASSMAKR